jgi:hypothetical protein
MKLAGRAGNIEIAAMLGFRDTGTEGALRLRRSPVSASDFIERFGTKELGEKK